MKGEYVESSGVRGVLFSQDVCLTNDGVVVLAFAVFSLQCNHSCVGVRKHKGMRLKLSLLGMSCIRFFLLFLPS